jgi:ATP-dependent HslUV protease ATP-binding subunit HslU
MILSMEPLESLRYLPWLSPHGIVVSSQTPVKNIPNYPDEETLTKALNALPAKRLVDDKALAREAGSGRAGNMVIVGAAIANLPLGMDDLSMNLQDMLGNAMPKRKKTRRLSVSEARVLLISEESQKLIDEEKVQHEAIRRAEQDGIVFIDEIDKIAGERSGGGPDVSREGVQRDILPIVEGSTVKTKYGTLVTDHILFIAAGAFHMSKPSDLIPELQGRFPIRVELDNLTEEDFIQILTKPKSALLKQYTALVGAENVSISFNKDAIAEIARVAFEVNESVENIGARRLHTIMSRLLEDILYKLPDETVKSVKITKSLVSRTFKDTMADQDLSKYIL